MMLMDKNYLIEFAKKYAAAWCSQKPELVAEFFSGDGSLKVNDSPPANGREAITDVAKSFMTAFPDMIVTFDELKFKPEGAEFHWTLKGTNTGDGGTGKKVNISGYELWKFGENKLIKESIGSFDAEEYERQLNSGE